MLLIGRTVTRDCACANEPSVKGEAGVTLLETLVTLAVVGILVALAVPALTHGRSRARLTQCQSNLRQLGIGMAIYTTDHGVFPMGGPQDWLRAGQEEEVREEGFCPSLGNVTYAHNRWGSSRFGETNHLGLGPRGGRGTTVPAVLAPSAMILFHDAHPLLPPPYSRPSAGWSSLGSPAQIPNVHGRVTSLAFVDGHGATPPLPPFTRGAPEVRPLWNLDHAAHDENWP